jgi:Spy/CpxP family protein refolding chaperone
MANMTKTGFAYLSLATALTLGGAGLLRAEAPSTGEHGRGSEWRSERLARILNLTDDQQASWKSMREQHRTEMEPLRQEGRDLHQKLRATMDAPNPDPAAVGTAMLALKQHREKMKAAETAFEGRLTSLLTPEQKTKYEALRAAHGSGRGYRGGWRAHPPAEANPDNPPGGQTEG